MEIKQEGQNSSHIVLHLCNVIYMSLHLNCEMSEVFYSNSGEERVEFCVTLDSLLHFRNFRMTTNQ